SHLVVTLGVFEEVFRDPPRPQRVAGKENNGSDRPLGSANVCTHDASIELIAQGKWTSPLCSGRSVARLAKTHVVVTMGTLRPMVTSLTEARTSFLSAIASESGEDQQLIVRPFEHVATEDLAARAAAYLGGAAHSPATLSRARDQATEVPLLAPASAAHERTSPRTVVQVCTDDSPFLVDSITEAISALGYRVHLIVHPIMPAGIASGRANGRDESWMHIEISRLADEESHERVRSTLTRV